MIWYASTIYLVSHMLIMSFQFELQSHLSKLSALPQLKLRTADSPGVNRDLATGIPGPRRRWPSYALSLWPDMDPPESSEDSKEVAMRFVRLFHERCPSLQYVCIDGIREFHDWNLQIIARSDGGFDLHELSFDEVLGIELFSLDVANYSDG